MVQSLRPWKTIIQLDFNAVQAVYLQIAEGIVREIKTGRLKPGAALPGTRLLADDLQVNRKTVILAYEHLILEGWLEAVAQKGTFVPRSLPDFTRPVATGEPFSFRHPRITIDSPHPPNTIVFDTGLPDVRLTPVRDLAKAYKRILEQKARWRLLGYGFSQGAPALRQAIATMLNHQRGMSVGPDELCITRGSQMALYLAAHSLLGAGDLVLMEMPGYLPTWEALESTGAQILPIPVDDKGLVTTELEKHCQTGRVKAIYVTPHHQFPTTVSMKMERRLHLISLSNKYGFAILEDDYDHEYHFEGKSLMPLASQQHAMNVIYIGSLSKVIAPAMRIGYIAGPASFIAALTKMRSIIDMQGDPTMEQAIAELMDSGAIARHSRKASAVYAQRRQLMEQLLQEHLGKYISYQKPDGGLGYWVKFHPEIDVMILTANLRKKGIAVFSPENMYYTGKAPNALRLGFSSLNEEELKDGIEKIAKTVKALR
ncbi:PLP-dependent aminotransferase family protein [Chitinophaga sp. 212800010-3]|uniref:MocR-like pyridoxine biosynthesis transcription factor PdxR n=1 Tax=unclassified Chitinophaga TaxID=2619133 RepID=UPI002DEBB958|nr:HTH gntR-type domain-containing protein [Chitinophaga sp. 212800010-3]